MTDKPTPWQRQTIPTGPHGWIQWKGTNVCMDIHCECGELSHIDADFAYNVRCGRCGKAYKVNGHVELVPLTDEEAQEETCMVVTNVEDD